MQFSWTGVLVAPLLAPLVFSIAMMGSFGGSDILVPFLVLLIPGAIVSYGATVCLLLPCLFFVSLYRRMTTLPVCLLGAALGATTFIGVTGEAWMSSGPDSGPPVENFFMFLIRWAADPIAAVFPLAGLVTAGLYWRLGAWRHRQPRADLAAPDSAAQ